jgi:ribosomal-protein-alanine N-acetyltransferase
MPKPKFKEIMIKIGKTRNKNLDSIINIEKQITSFGMKKSQYADELLNPLSHFYVVCIPKTGEVVGYIIFWVIEKLIEIHHIAVSPKHQKMGIGHALMKFILDQARQNEISEIYLEVRKSNMGAIQFYQRFGFKKQGTRKEYYQNPIENALIYKKKIKNSIQEN